MDFDVINDLVTEYDISPVEWELEKMEWDNLPSELDNVNMTPEEKFVQNARKWFREGSVQSAVKASMPAPSAAPAKAVKGGC
ncbi:MAG: hypothetical protein BWY70_00507 [Bacteroidetes bacterium ADurb.Bin408]|nr:MAG: hypothetical protein BWY70_00507 [Bacteroidetes bacterium ADurb.Bin408]